MCAVVLTFKPGIIQKTVSGIKYIKIANSFTNNFMHLHAWFQTAIRLAKYYCEIKVMLLYMYLQCTYLNIYNAIKQQLATKR